MRPLLFVPFLLFLLFPAACSVEPPAQPTAESDPFAGDEPTDVLSLSVRLRDETPEAGSPTLLAEQTWHLAGARACVEEAGRRVVLGEGAVATLAPAGRVAPRRIADLFEGGDTRRASYAPVVEEHVYSGPAGPHGPLRIQEIRLRHRARDESGARAVEAKLTVWFATPAPEQAALARLVIDLVGLPFLDDEGRVALHRTDAARGLPARWWLQVSDERLAAAGSAPVLAGEVVAVAAERLPRRHFAMGSGPWAAGAELAGGSRAGAPPPHAPADPVEAPGPLLVRNRTPFFLHVLGAGAVVARVAPQAELSVGGLTPGYYRLYARTLFGTFHEGPRDLYVPGTFTIER